MLTPICLAPSWIEHSQVGDLEHPLGVHLHREAVGHSRVSQQLLGHVDVLLALGHRRVGGREHRSEPVVVAQIGEALEEAVDDPLTVEGERDRLAHPLVLERIMSTRMCTSRQALEGSLITLRWGW